MINAGSMTGTWLLKSFATEFEDGTRHLPYGGRPSGRISYTGDGFMLAHLWNPDLWISDLFTTICAERTKSP